MARLRDAPEDRPGPDLARLAVARLALLRSVTGPGGNEQVMVFERSAAGLQRRHVLTLARFVRLHGRYGFPSR